MTSRPADGSETARSCATSGSRPMMMNSVVPMAKALIASASNGMGMTFSGGRRKRRPVGAAPHKKRDVRALSRRCLYLIIGVAFEPFSKNSGKSNGSTGRYPAIRRGGGTGQPVRCRPQAEPHAGRRERAPRETRGEDRDTAVRTFDAAIAAHRRRPAVPELLPPGAAGARRRGRDAAGRPQRRRRQGAAVVDVRFRPQPVARLARRIHDTPSRRHVRADGVRFVVEPVAGRDRPRDPLRRAARRCADRPPSRDEPARAVRGAVVRRAPRRAGRSARSGPLSVQRDHDRVRSDERLALHARRRGADPQGAGRDRIRDQRRRPHARMDAARPRHCAEIAVGHRRRRPRGPAARAAARLAAPGRAAARDLSQQALHGAARARAARLSRRTLRARGSRARRPAERVPLTADAWPLKGRNLTIDVARPQPAGRPAQREKL
ncbi:hypothetical protein EMIT0111MI5_50089 [Burkholderia sp. IT-111MI5]